MNAATTSTNEPQTAEYQAAMDNVHFEQMRAARSQKAQWDFDLINRVDRWNYISDLEEQIIRVCRPHLAKNNTRN